MPEGTSAILDARTLAVSHRRLAELLEPGLRVLDVGCGTGAITRGIAEAVGPGGRVVGIDVHPGLIEQARRAHGGVPALSFEAGDVQKLAFLDTFDIVTAARVLQWLDDAPAAVHAMTRAVRPGGRLVVLDYNHEKIRWTPDPPASMRAFYAAFLRWRAEAGMDNAMADHLPGVFARMGLVEVAISPQHEVTGRGDPDFDRHIGIWAEVAATRGLQMVEDGAVTETERALAEAEYRAWIRDRAEAHTLYLLAVEGVRSGDEGDPDVA